MHCVGIERQLFGHEAYFDKRPHAILQQPVIDLVDIGEVIYRVSVLVLVIDAHLIVEYGVEAYIAEISHLLHGAEILAIALAERKNRPARAKHLLPEMREWLCGGLRIDVDGLLGKDKGADAQHNNNR